MPEVTELFPAHKVIDRTVDERLARPELSARRSRDGSQEICHRRPLDRSLRDVSDARPAERGFEITLPRMHAAIVSPEAHNRSMDRLSRPARSRSRRFSTSLSSSRTGLARETYEGVMEILRGTFPYGIQVRFSKWALGEHASEGGLKPISAA